MDSPCVYIVYFPQVYSQFKAICGILYSFLSNLSTKYLILCDTYLSSIYNSNYQNDGCNLSPPTGLIISIKGCVNSAFLKKISHNYS